MKNIAFSDLKACSHSLIILGTTGLLLALAFPAEGLAKKGHNPWKEFEKAEEKYKDLSKDYKKLARSVSGDKAELLEKLSKHYDEMADIKEDAARDMRKGRYKDFDWSEYEKLSKEVHVIEAKLGLNKKNTHKKDTHKKDGSKKDKSYHSKDKSKESLKDKEQRLKELEKLLDEKEKLIDEKKRLLEKD